MRVFHVLSSVVVVVAAFCASSCTPSMIPETQIEDTEENRHVLTFLARYESAVTQKNVDAVLALCAADYYEDNGNVDAKDDYNRDGLQQRLTEQFAKTKELEMQLFVQKIDRSRDSTVGVNYRYNTRALMQFPAGEKWVTTTDVNQLVIRPVIDENNDDPTNFRIVSGL
jgi:hypothetical protein